MLKILDECELNSFDYDQSEKLVRKAFVYSKNLDSIQLIYFHKKIKKNSLIMKQDREIWSILTKTDQFKMVYI